ncbi:MAG TPA: O-antigen ligase family protein [Bacteroidia bacterium]|jgi:hypothetical protein|nr:O-antigen ligase family protein [Bacteroidia bacterium]
MKKETFVDFLIFTSIFISTITFFTTPFEGYLHYLIFLLLFPFFIQRYGLPKVPFQIILLPFFVGVFQVMMGNNEWFLFLKIFSGVLLSTIFYYYVIQYYDIDVEKMFSLYLKWAYWSAIIGIIQYISFKIHFKPGYDYGWIFNKWSAVAGEGALIRINSIYMEPAQLGIMLGPAAFVAILNIFRKQNFEYKNYQNYIILIVIYLSKSSTGYIGVFTAILFIGINLGYLSYLLLSIVFGVFGVIGLYNYADEFKGRVDAAMALWIHQNYKIENVNTSSFVQYNNAHVAFENFKEHPLFGTGMGSHLVAYEKYSYTRTGEIGFKGTDLNSTDANSLFLRLVSETGLMGVLFFIIVIMKCFVGNSGTDDPHWIISGALLVLIVLCLIRQGNYFLNGFPFFLWLYYYNKIEYNNKSFIKKDAS